VVTSALDRGRWWASRSGRFTQRTRSPSTSKTLVKRSIRTKKVVSRD